MGLVLAVPQGSTDITKVMAAQRLVGTVKEA
jgi:hypothetical protein